VADLRISELPSLSGTDLAATDLVPVADLSASETKKLTGKELIQNGIALIDNGTIPGAKLVSNSVTALQLGPDSVTASELADGSVDTAALIDLAVTNSKIAPGVDGAKLTNDTVTAAKIPSSSLNRGLDKAGGAIGHTNAVTASTRSGISFDAQGHVTGAVAIVPSDLPLATTTAAGIVSVPATSGLTVSGVGALAHANAITAGTRSGVTYDAQGHITAIAPLTGSDLPVATATTLGGVTVPGPSLTVSGTGALTHNNSGVAPGTYTKTTVDDKGHVISGSLLVAGDIPPLDASKINTGQFDPARIAPDSITNDKLANYATTLIQEPEPTQGEYVGQFWYKESDAQLRTWSGNSWIPVGFGRLSNENLRFCGTFDASTGRVGQTTAFGVQAGLADGQVIPGAAAPLTGVYLVAATPGTYAGDVYDNGDWVLCIGTAWIRIDTLSAGGGITIRLSDLLDTTITTPQAGDTLIFDATTNRWINRPTAAQKATFVEALNGTRTTFTLTRDASSVNNLIVSLGGVIQEPGATFTFVAPRTVNFVTPPPAGLDYWVLIEGVQGAGGGGGGTALPDGTAAEEVLGWSATLGAWQPKAVIEGGVY